jgi:Uma2 family endonuclease
LTHRFAVTTIDAMATYPIRTRHWTRKEYDRLVTLGVIDEDEPIELIGGQMIVAEPKGTPHQAAIGLTTDALRLTFGSGWVIRVQSSVALDDESEPEPDIAVVPGRHRDYLGEHPARPALIVEVAQSSLSFDRRYKGSVYARAGITDYWIVNLRRRVLEVYREPVADAASRFGWKYDRVRILKATASVSPLAMPTALVAVADLLP